MTQVLRGNIVHAPAMGRLDILEHGCLVLEDGVITGLYPDLPAHLEGAEVRDFGDRIIMQSFADMHLHAPQYPMLGMGMDLPLLDWLNTYTFPTEARFADLDYARRVYRRLATDLITNGTTRVCMFSSLHTDATLVLMDELERAGVTGYVGKVNMDRNGLPGKLQETTEESVRETLRWLDACRFEHIKPILTPRFTPSCTDELMTQLGKLANERGLYVQSHLSESTNEIAWVKELHPECSQYWETYDKYGLWKDHTLMAHCVWSDERERAAIRDAGVVVVHCGDSNVNICSGLCPVRQMVNEGLWVTLGSDIAVDAADIALVSDDIQELPHLLWLAKRMMGTIRCNMSFSMALNFVAILLAIGGILNPVVGALVHNAGSVLVIINSAFLLHWKKKA